MILKSLEKKPDCPKAQPINVSEMEPVYDDKGGLTGWHISVTTSNNYFSPFLIKSGIPVNVPQPRGAKIYSWETDWSKSNQMTVRYFFKNGLFGHGVERALQFRMQMLEQIACHKRNEDIK